MRGGACPALPRDRRTREAAASVTERQPRREWRRCRPSAPWRRRVCVCADRMRSSTTRPPTTNCASRWPPASPPAPTRSSSTSCRGITSGSRRADVDFHLDADQRAILDAVDTINARHAGAARMRVLGGDEPSYDHDLHKHLREAGLPRPRRSTNGRSTPRSSREAVARELGCGRGRVPRARGARASAWTSKARSRSSPPGRPVRRGSRPTPRSWWRWPTVASGCATQAGQRRPRRFAARVADRRRDRVDQRRSAARRASRRSPRPLAGRAGARARRLDVGRARPHRRPRDRPPAVRPPDRLVPGRAARARQVRGRDRGRALVGLRSGMVG